jgi:hypothetical protein
MTKMRTLLLAAAAFSVASPALAAARMPINPWAPVWACTAYEYAKRCNVELTHRSQRCQCIGGGSMGWRLNEYYGPGARNLAPRGDGP